MEKRIALVGIIVEDKNSVRLANDLLHEYGDYIISRTGIPYREKGLNIISIVMDAPENIISTLSGRLGMLPGINVKSMLAKVK